MQQTYWAASTKTKAMWVRPACTLERLRSVNRPGCPPLWELRPHPSQMPPSLAPQATVGDRLLAKHYGYGSTPSADPAHGGKLVAVPPPTGVPQHLVWAKNEFPYHMDEDIQHNLVWSAAGGVSEEALMAFVDTQRPRAEGWESLLFCNPPHLQSIRNVWHAHVLSRKIPT